MSVKLALDISKVNVPKTFRESIERGIPEAYLISHPFGKENRIFEEFVYDVLKTFQNDISAIFIEDILDEDLNLAQNIRGYAKEHGYECLKREDGNVTFTVLPEDPKVFLDYAESCILHDKIEACNYTRYIVIRLETLVNAHKGVKNTSSFRFASFYKEAFKEHLDFLNGYIASDI